LTASSLGKADAISGSLMLMAKDGNPALQLLLEKDVDVNSRDDEGRM